MVILKFTFNQPIMKNYLKLFAVTALFYSCDNSEKATQSKVEVDQETIGKHIERLASDEFLGRKPFTEGEVITVNYLKDEFEKFGLSPGNGDSFYQDVPMVEITGSPSEKMTM